MSLNSYCLNYDTFSLNLQNSFNSFDIRSLLLTKEKKLIDGFDYRFTALIY